MWCFLEDFARLISDKKGFQSIFELDILTILDFRMP